ncbi:MAG TPA: hypothetical protein VGI39_25395 [Polyangiaceae bacterium]|jgi:hypothetical protein
MGLHADASYALPRAVTATSLAESCRQAGLLFLEGAAADWWGKAELVGWLEGPYKEATRFARLGWRASSPPPPLRPSRPPLAGGAEDEELLRPERIEAVIREARWHVLAALEALALPAGSHAWVERALARGHVVPRRDSEGDATWVPVDLRGLRLRDRVESLFAADHLARPRDYAVDLIVCHRCEAVVFDHEARARGDCGAHTRTEFDWDQNSRVHRVARAIEPSALGVGPSRSNRQGE